MGTIVKFESAIVELRVPHLTVRQGGRLSRKDAAAFLGMKPSTLKSWRRCGFGPRSIKVGGRCFYDIVELKAFSAGGSY